MRLSRTAPALGAALVAALALWTIFTGLGSGSLSDWDEATYGQIAREMLDSGRWLTPYWNGLPFHDKPPTQFWLMAAGLRAGLTSELAIRLPAACAGLLAVGLTAWLGASMFSRATGLLAAILLLTGSTAFSNFALLSRQGMLDVPFTACAIWALVHFWKGLTRPSHWTAMGVPLGLAVMTKGLQTAPVVAALVASILLLRLMRQPLCRAHVRAAGLALVLAAAICLPWHLAQVTLNGREFLDGYILVHLRKTGHAESGNSGRWLFYATAIYGAVPHGWWVVGPALALSAWQTVRRPDPRLGVLLLWVTVPVVAYSLASTKIPWYVLPVQPAIALLLAHQVTTLIPRHRAALATVFAGTVVCVAAWNHHVLGQLDTARDVKAMGATVDRVTRPEAVIGFWDPNGTYQVPERPNFDVRPAVRFYANRPMVALTSQAHLERWLSGGGDLIWDDQTFPHAPVPVRTRVVAEAGAQRYLQVVRPDER